MDPPGAGGPERTRRAVALGRLPTCWDRVTNASAGGGPNRSGARLASRRSRAMRTVGDTAGSLPGKVLRSVVPGPRHRVRRVNAG
ncbi:hypothetical protein KBX37_23950 [Micromonospora sp. U56]|uniref:hypothetical protein n=1 Tax=Micromonospora sp. U56 TaxID=2824900 RepID=UPI001B387160|nr:hypothetical protein [Micromonospora sp. U56]MBQ0896110.1 hypothetical protein [Micromonospora sp. U56]